MTPLAPSNSESQSSAWESEVRRAAFYFRAALIEGGLEWELFKDFPRGVCGDTCLLLGQYLSNLGLGEWLYCSGSSYGPNGEFRSHAWLVQNGWIVDITADQFEDVTETVTFTRDWTWYRDRFPEQTMAMVAGTNYFDPQEGRRLLHDFQVLEQRANQASR
ncbi:MAG: hypothetical protein Q7K25_04940 [Actinomycetota bacterium]|nr:hypothetical protein [Actinomycetota bacterium]